MENVFSRVSFRGSFRSYQQAVLDEAERYLADKKLHIVAAPGSGKTVLGLELIRRVGKRALILSPSVTVRQQWGERFEELFLPDGEKRADYVSGELGDDAPICSITYQALHAASRPDEDGTPHWMEAVRKMGVGTLCLDEAHHLRSEWQKSLEALLAFLGRDVTVIALTATPPYDSNPAEWERYIRVCGEIDAEIFVPELVAQKTLCPHQDYIYFSYPDAKESDMLAEYRARADRALETIRAEGLLERALRALPFDTPSGAERETLLENADELVDLLSLAAALGFEPPKEWQRLLLPSGRLPACGEEEAERALDFVLRRPELFGAEITERLRALLDAQGLLDGGRLYLSASPQLQKKMLSSLGKLESIEQIVQSEIACCGRGLRMLILTDHIRRGMLSIVGSAQRPSVMGSVPVFETVRRVCPYETRLALLTGTLVIVPNAVGGELLAAADARGLRASLTPIGDTWYSELTLPGGSRDSVALLTEAFEKGLLHILVGTKALLGEGWDSPCVNSLVLASFVGSFMSSNQMRGRAIRIDRAEPQKASNIWHLVTLLPPEGRLAFLQTEEEEALGEDWALMRRRFECFMAPAYSGETIESGLERVDILRPPFTRERVAEINAEMLARAADRRGMAESWEKALMLRSDGHVRETVRASGAIKPRLYAAGAGGSAALHGVVFGALGALCLASPPAAAYFALLPLMGVSAYSFASDLKRSLGNSSAKKSVERLASALLAALRKTGAIESERARPRIDVGAQGVACSLEGASVREENLFVGALGELLSPLENPRYLLIRLLSVLGIPLRLPSQSYACPSLLGGKKETAELLRKELEASGDRFELVYTRSEEGRKTLLDCRRAANEGRREAKVVRSRSLAADEKM